MNEPGDVDERSKRYEQIKQIFLEVARRDPSDQQAFLKQACGDDEQLHREVESLLAHHQPESSFLDPIVPHFGGSAPLLDSSGSSHGDSTLLDQGRFSTGTILNGRYRITALLGRGGMGEVYRADDLVLGQTVALKFLPARLTNDGHWLERFHNEVRMARQISHPNVCRVYDIGQAQVTSGEGPRPDALGPDAQQTFLSMEYIDGENLSSLLRRIGRVPKDRAVEFTRQLCAGLAAAHRKNVLHRDLKPTNVMIDGRGQVRITDFGLAMPLGGTTSAEIRAGTPAYMAPEQITGKNVSVASDIYSLGLVLYEMFTGKQVFKADNVAEYEHLHSSSQPTHPSHLVEMDEPAQRIILRCLEKQPQHRPASALAVAAALPGGDPLAAALAAGETPSPEMVAAAGGAGVVRPALAFGALVLILAGMSMALWLSDKVNLINQVPMTKPPLVLAERAREIATTFGYSDPAQARIYGFVENQPYLDYLEDLYEKESWSQLSTGQPAGIQFWYRQSADYLIPTDRKQRVTLADPPASEPGEIGIVLDPDGRLVKFTAVPVDGMVAPPTGESYATAPVNWSKVFEAAGLRIESFTNIAPTRAPPVFADQRARWVGNYPSNPFIKIDIDTAAYRDKVVYFAIVTPWEVQSAAEVDLDTTASRKRGSLGRRLQLWLIIQNIMFVAALTFGLLLAWRNLKLGRGDRRGAFRISTFIFLTAMVGGLLMATHSPDFLGELQLFGEVGGKSLYLAAQIWLFYMALEPFVRRIWPETIISWSRLLAGRFRDPLLGRSILIGGLYAAWALVVIQLGHLLPQWLGRPMAQPDNDPSGDLARLLGSRFSLAYLAQAQFRAIYFALLFLLVLLLLRVAIRKVLLLLGRPLRYIWLAEVSFVLVVSAAQFEGFHPWIRGPIIMVLVAIMTYILTHHGLVAVMASFLLYILLTDYPLTPHPSAWYAAAGYYALATATLIVGYGFYISQAGRPLLQDEFLET